jgi:hypothetical protein
VEFLGRVLDGVTVGMLIGICGVQILSGMSVRGPPSKECLTWNRRWLKIIESPANNCTCGLLLFNWVVALMPSVLLEVPVSSSSFPQNRDWIESRK